MSGDVSIGSRKLGELRDARETARLRAYVAEAWSRRQYVWYVAGSELRARQVNTVLGNLWHVINPMLQVGVFFLIFGLVLEIDRGTDNFVGFLAVGIFVYSFTQKCATAGAKAMTKYRGLMQIVSFPRALLPLTTTLTEALAIIPAYVVMFVVVLATGESPEFSWLLVPVVAAVQMVFNAGLAMVVARATARVADVQQILPFVFRLGFYASGVLFNVNAYLDGKNYRLLFELNPMYCFIEINRWLVLDYQQISPRLVVVASVWTVVLAVGGTLWFRAGEDTYGSH